MKLSGKILDTTLSRVHNSFRRVEHLGSPSKDFFMTTTNHPIDHAIVALLFLVEGICWIVNELAGFHSPLTAETAEPEVDDPREIYAVEASFAYVDDCTFTGSSHDLDWEDYVEAYSHLATRKVVELRKMARGLAQNVHLMRKSELIALLA